MATTNEDLVMEVRANVASALAGLDRLEDQAKKTSKNMGRMGAPGLNKIGQETEGLRAKFKRLGGEIRSSIIESLTERAVGVVIQGLRAIGGVLVDSIGSASDYNESINKLIQVYGDLDAQGNRVEGSMTAMIQKFADDAPQAFGLTRAQAIETIGTFGNFVQAMGLPQQAAAEMSMNLTALAADLGSFNNLDPTEVLDKLSSGLAGNSIAVRDLGIDLSDMTLRAKAMEQGIYDGTGVLSMAQKAAAAYEVIIEQTTAAQGDFARTSDDLANATRILKATWEDGKEELGRAFLPIVLEAVRIFRDLLPKAIDQAVKWTEQIIEWFRSFGITSEQVAQAVSAAWDMIVSYLEWAGGIVGDVINGIINAWNGLMEFFGISTGEFVILLVTWVQNLWNWAKVWWIVLSAIAKVVWQGLTAVAGIISDLLGSTVDDTDKGTRTWLEQWKEGGLGLLDIMATTMDKLGKIIKDGVNLVTGYLNYLLSPLIAIGVVDPVVSWADDIDEIFSGVADSLAEARGEIESTFNSSISALVRLQQIGQTLDDSKLGNFADKQRGKKPFEFTIPEFGSMDPDIWSSGLGDEGGGSAGPKDKADKAKRDAQGAEKTMIDLAKSLAEAWTAGLRAMRLIMESEVPLIDEIMPQIERIQAFLLDIGLRLQAIGRTLGVGELENLQMTGDALAGGISVMADTLSLAQALTQIDELPSESELNNLVPIIERVFSIMKDLSFTPTGAARVTEVQVEEMERFGKAVQGAAATFQSIVALDLSEIVEQSEEDLDIARVNASRAFVHFANLTAAFRELKGQEQERIVSGFEIFARGATVAADTFRAVAQLDLGSVVKQSEADLSIARENAVAAWLHFANMSAPFRDLTLERQSEIVEGFERFNAALQAASAGMQAAGEVRIADVTAVTERDLDTARHNAVRLWTHFYVMQRAFGEWDDRDQLDLLDDFARFAEAFQAAATTFEVVNAIQLVAPSRVTEDTLDALRHNASRMFVHMANLVKAWHELGDKAQTQWVASLTTFQSAMESVSGILTAIVEMIVAPDRLRALIGSEGADTILTRSVFGWTAQLIEGLVYRGALLSRWLNQATASWDAEVTPALTSYTKSVEASTGALGALVDIITKPEELPELGAVVGEDGAVIIRRSAFGWTQDLIERLVAAGATLAQLLMEATRTWETEVNPGVDLLSTAVGQSTDLLSTLLDIIQPPEASVMMGAPGTINVVFGWTLPLVQGLVDQGKRLADLIDEAVGVYETEVNPAVELLDDRVSQATGLLSALLDVFEPPDELFMSDVAPVGGSALKKVWTIEMIQALVDQADMLADLLDQALVNWQGKVNPKVDTLATIVSSVTTAMSAMVDLQSISIIGAQPIDERDLDIMIANIELITLKVGEIGEALGTDLLTAAKEAGEAAGPAIQAVQDIFGLIPSILSSGFFRTSNRIGGAQTSAQFGNLRSLDRFSEMIKQAIQSALSTVKDAVSGFEFSEGEASGIKRLGESMAPVVSMFKDLETLSDPVAIARRVADAMRELAGVPALMGPGGAGSGYGTVELPVPVEIAGWARDVQLIPPSGGFEVKPISPRGLLIDITREQAMTIGYAIADGIIAKQRRGATLPVDPPGGQPAGMIESARGGIL